MPDTGKAADVPPDDNLSESATEDDTVRSSLSADPGWEPPEADDDLSWLPAELANGVRMRRWLEREDSRSDENDPVWWHRWALNELDHEKATVDFLLPQAKRKAVKLRGQLTELVRNASRTIDDIERLGVTARLRRTRGNIYRECFSLVGQLDDPFSVYERADFECAGESFLQLKPEDSLPLVDDVRAVGLQIIETPDGDEFGGFELVRTHLESLAERVALLESSDAPADGNAATTPGPKRVGTTPTGGNVDGSAVFGAGGGESRDDSSNHDRVADQVMLELSDAEVQKLAKELCEWEQYLAWLAEQYAIWRNGTFKDLPRTYVWLEDNFDRFAEDIPNDLRGYILPKKESTWKRRVGAVRKATKTNVKSSRKGRPHGKSVVMDSDL
ncbi:MAG: hypothetical protein HQ518_08170 [Rhodopirellula sp.]|nr:hypothetical protein [Rhodopirellula sp.]